jgi:hypothetical protein
MAFETGTAIDLEDLISKISTFATANGWVEDERNNSTGDFALHKTGGFGDIYVSFRWDPASKQHLSVHQALGYTGGNDSGNHPDDSGNGYNATSSHSNTLLDDERHVSDIGDGPFPSYHLFEDDHYLHIVVEISTDIFRHFGFGLLSPKFGTWTGGEYAYGMRMGLGTSHHAVLTTDHALLDGLSIEADQNATVHAEGLAGEAGATKWLVAFGSLTQPTETDTGGQARARGQGGFRAGPVARENGAFRGSNLTGSVALYVIQAWHIHSTLPRVYLIGELPDVRALNIRSFQPKEEVGIGGDTWVIFPFALRTEDNVANRTYYSGIAYKKVTT